MAYFKTCPYCDANLDPGEKCECNGKRPYIRQSKKTYRRPAGYVFITCLDGQIKLIREGKYENIKDQIKTC